MNLKETLIKSEEIYKGRVVSLRVDTVQVPDGRTTTREVVEHRGAVAIVPLLGLDKVLMVRQYRRAVDDVLIEIPAGTLEPGEAVEICAARELEEETGYVAGKIEPLFSQYLAPGYSQEVLHVFLAQDLRKTKQNTERDEFIEVLEVKISDIYSMIQKKQIKDAKTIAGLLMTLRILDK